jgi:hypothetical protein
MGMTEPTTPYQRRADGTKAFTRRLIVSRPVFTVMGISVGSR